MIDEAIGKILGMAMAYGVSSLGLFLAYVNYRKRKLQVAQVILSHGYRFESPARQRFARLGNTSADK
jgi:hypothetical protein